MISTPIFKTINNPKLNYIII